MKIYILKRILLIFPTLFFIMLLNFSIIQMAPGGPVEKLLSNLSNHNKLSGEISSQNIANNSSLYNLSQKNNSIDEETLQKIKKLYGFDKSFWERFFLMLKDFLFFDFKTSFYSDKKVVDLVIEKLPTSLSIGLWSTLLIYAISIPLGIKKAVKNGSKFDITTSYIVSIMYAIPGFLFAILLIILFASPNFIQIFPMRGLYSDNFSQLSFFAKICDYFWHLILPIISISIGGFASLTFFTKNSFIEEVNKQYVLTAYSKGLDEKKVLYKHIFRNAMMIIIAAIPSSFVAILFGSSMLIEVIFSLDGLGLLGYEAALSRDFPVMFGTLYFFTLLGLIINIISDLIYKIVDPRINFD